MNVGSALALAADHQEFGKDRKGDLFRCDRAKVEPGRAKYSLIVQDDGGILDDLMITNTGSALYLVVNGDAVTNAIESVITDALSNTPG